MRRRCARSARALRRALPVAIALLAAGCGLRRAPALLLAPGEALVFGQVWLGPQPSVGQLVKLYDQTEAVLYDSLRTDAAGHYGFGSAPAGGLMVKASSTDPLDFSYVRYQLTRGTSTERDSIPPMDLRAHGCALLSPADSASVPAPNPGAPITFGWGAVAGATSPRYKPRLADGLDSTVWEPASSTALSATFNGIGTAGAYAGQLVPPGTYSWRVKVHFRNGLQAATRSRTIVFAPAP